MAGIALPNSVFSLFRILIFNWIGLQPPNNPVLEEPKMKIQRFNYSCILVPLFLLCRQGIIVLITAERQLATLEAVRNYLR